MFSETISQIEAKIRNAESMSPETKAEYVKLLQDLRAEITELSETDRDQAQSIAGFTEMTAHEATREQKNPRLFGLSVDGLASSVEGFEVSHPRLVQCVNSICNALSNLGI